MNKEVKFVSLFRLNIHYKNRKKVHDKVEHKCVFSGGTINNYHKKSNNKEVLHSKILWFALNC